jgi:hypothetical protein
MNGSRSIELIPNGLAVSRRCTCPTFIHICRTIRLSETIVALGSGSFNGYAKHFEVDQNGDDFATAARFHQLFI